MEIKVLNEEKDSLELQVENLTLVELLRVYLNKDSAVTFVAWKRDHPTENPILKIKTKGKTPKKALNEAIDSVIKELNNIEKEFSKLK